MKKAAKPLLITSLVLGILYLGGVLLYFAFVRSTTSATLGASGMSGYNAFAQYGISYVFNLLLPHLLTCGIAIVFNIIAIVKKDIPWFALIAGILFAVSLLFAYGSYWMGVIVEAVICIIAFAGLMQKDKSVPSMQQQTTQSIGENVANAHEPMASGSTADTQKPIAEQMEEEQ